MKQDFSRRTIRYTASDKIFLAIDYLVLACFRGFRVLFGRRDDHVAFADPKAVFTGGL